MRAKLPGERRSFYVSKLNCTRRCWLKVFFFIFSRQTARTRSPGRAAKTVVFRIGIRQGVKDRIAEAVPWRVLGGKCCSIR